jgi:hypothetical protein
VFNFQGYLFLKELQAEEGAETMPGYLDNLGEVHTLYTKDVLIALTDNTKGGNGMVNAIVSHCSHVHNRVAIALLLHLQA